MTTKINRIKIVEYNTWSLTEHERAIFLDEIFNVLFSKGEDCLDEDFVSKLEDSLAKILRYSEKKMIDYGSKLFIISKIANGSYSLTNKVHTVYCKDGEEVIDRVKELMDKDIGSNI